MIGRTMQPNNGDLIRKQKAEWEALRKEHLDEFKQVLQEGWPLMLELPPPLSQGMIEPSHQDAEGLEQQKEAEQEEGGEAG